MALSKRFAVTCDCCGRTPSDSTNLRGFDTPREARKVGNSRTRRLVVAVQEYERSYYGGAGHARTVRRPIRADLCDRCWTPEAIEAYRLLLDRTPHLGDFLPTERNEAARRLFRVSGDV